MIISAFRICQHIICILKNNHDNFYSLARRSRNSPTLESVDGNRGNQYFIRPSARLDRQQIVNCRGVRAGRAGVFHKCLIDQAPNRCGITLIVLSLILKLEIAFYM